MGVLRDLRRYLTRPIIPFCFGVPLLLPATLLTVVAFLQNHISTTLHVLGILFLTLSVFSIICGMVLGFYDVCRPKPKRPTTKGFQRVRRKITKGKRSRSLNSISPEIISTSSSLNSPRTPSGSFGPGVHVVFTNEKARLVTQIQRKKSRKHRLFGRKNIFPIQQSRMPSLKEEDHSHASDNPENVPRIIRSSKSERTVANLEKHLREIGLGVTEVRAQSPVDVEMLLNTPSVSNVRNQATTLQLAQHTRSKSLPEGDFQKIMPKPKDEPIVVGSARQEEMLRRSARAARREQDFNQLQQPVLSSESHERTGIRINIGSTLL